MLRRQQHFATSRCALLLCSSPLSSSLRCCSTDLHGSDRDILEVRLPASPFGYEVMGRIASPSLPRHLFEAGKENDPYEPEDDRLNVLLSELCSACDEAKKQLFVARSTARHYKRRYARGRRILNQYASEVLQDPERCMCIKRRWEDGSDTPVQVPF